MLTAYNRSVFLFNICGRKRHVDAKLCVAFIIRYIRFLYYLLGLSALNTALL